MQQALLDLALENSGQWGGAGAAKEEDDEEGSDEGGDGGPASASRPPGSSGPEDPLARVDLRAHLGGVFGRLLAGGEEARALLAAAGAEMSGRQEQAVRAVLTAGGTGA